MSALLDTHVLVWALVAPERLSRRVQDRIRDRSADLFVSVASLYEIEYKRERDQVLYRLPHDLPSLADVVGFEWLDIDPGDAFQAARLSDGHRDPWDRIIAIQAGRRDLPLVTTDAALTKACVTWRVQTLW